MTYQEWVVRQPIKFGGMGLRSLVETSPAAYLGALETAIPSFTGDEGICPQLEAVIGGPETWGVDTSSDSRWEVFLQSGVRDSIKLQLA